MAAFAQFIPFVVTGPLAGSLADRVPRRALLLVTHVALTLNTLALWAMWVGGARSPWPIVALLVVQGFITGLLVPSWQAFVTELVPRADLHNAIALNSAQFNASRAFGPALGGLLLATLGPGWSFFLNAMSFLAVIGGLLLIRLPATRRDAGAPKTARHGVLREFAQSIRYIRTQRGIAACVLVVVTVGLLTSPLFSLLIVFAEEVFDVGRGLYGLLGAAIGIGAVLATPFVSSRHIDRPRGPFVAGAVAIHACAAIGFALAPTYWLGIAALLVMGGTYLAWAATLNTVLQLRVEDARRGRVLAVYLMGLTVALPVGALIQGLLVEHVGPRPTVAGAGLLLLVSTGVLLATGWFAAMDAPAPAGSIGVGGPDTATDDGRPDAMAAATHDGRPDAGAVVTAAADGRPNAGAVVTAAADGRPNAEAAASAAFDAVGGSDGPSEEDRAWPSDTGVRAEAEPATPPDPVRSGTGDAVGRGDQDHSSPLVPARRADSQPETSGHQRQAGPGR
jgi:MFS family permease